MPPCRAAATGGEGGPGLRSLLGRRWTMRAEGRPGQRPGFGAPAYGIKTVCVLKGRRGISRHEEIAPRRSGHLAFRRSGKLRREHLGGVALSPNRDRHRGRNRPLRHRRPLLPAAKPACRAEAARLRREPRLRSASLGAAALAFAVLKRKLAERGRFELPVPSLVHLISSQAHSTTLTPLRD